MKSRPFKEEVQEFISLDRKNLTLEETKKGALALVRRANLEAKKTDESEKTHPVYFALTYLVSAQFCVFEEKEGWEKNSDQYIKKALSYLTKNKNTLTQDSEWLSYRQKLMELFNHHFLVLLNKLITILKSEEVDAVSRVICADYREFECFYMVKLNNELITRAAVSFELIEEVLNHIEDYKESVARLNEYYVQSSFSQADVLWLFLSVIKKHILFSLRSILNERKPTIENPNYSALFLDLTVAMQFITNDLASGAFKRTAMVVSEHHVLHVAVMANRLLMMRCLGNKGFWLLYVGFLTVLDKQMMRVWCKDSKDIQINMLYQQFCFDKWCSMKDNSDLIDPLKQTKMHIDGYLQGHVVQPIDTMLHIMSVWHSLMSIADNLFKQYQKFYRFKYRSLKFKSQLEADQHFQQQVDKNLSMTDICSLSIHRQNVQDVIAALKAIEPSVHLIKLLPDGFKTPFGLMPLPRMTTYLPFIFKLLPTVEVLWPVQKGASLHEQYLEAGECNTDLVAMKVCYSKIKEIMCIFGKHTDWSMWGSEKNIVVLDGFANQYIEPRLQSIVKKQKDVNQILINDEETRKKLDEGRMNSARLFIEEENNKNHSRKQKRKLKWQLKQDNKVKESQQAILSRQNDNESNEPDDDYVDEQNDLEFAYSIEAIRKGHHYKACEEYSHDPLQSNDGRLLAQVEIIIQQIFQLQRQLRAISVSKKTVDEKQADACNNEVKKLQNEYNTLLAHYSSNNITGVLKERRQDLELAWKNLCSTKDAVTLRMNLSRYTKIMILGFNLQNLEDQQERNTLFEFGKPHYVHGKTLNHHNHLHKKFSIVYQTGHAEFVKRGEHNRQTFHKESPYASMREVLVDLEDMIYSAYVQFDLEEEQLPSSSSSAAASKPKPKAPNTTSKTTLVKPSTTTTMMSASELLHHLCHVRLMTESEKQFLSTWVKANPKNLFTLEQEKLVDANLAYEAISAWLISTDIKERVNFLNDTGLLRWFLSIPGDGCLISRDNIKHINGELDKIAAWLHKIPSTKWQTGLILARTLTSIIMLVLDRELLLDNLVHFGLKDRLLRKICDALALSRNCQSALYEYLSTYLKPHLIVSPHSCKSVCELEEKQYQYNQKLLQECNVQKRPVHVLVYGSSAYCSLISTSKHVPADLDVRTNLPLTEWKMTVSLHDHLSEQRIYRVTKDDSITIKSDTTSILQALRFLDFTISQAMYDPGLGKVIFFTQESFDDLQNQVLRFAQPKEKFQENPKLFVLRVLIMSRNTGFPLSDTDASFLHTLMQTRIEKAVQNGRTFLTPELKPGELLYFLFKHFLDRSAEVYFMLAHQHHVLPLLFPLPVAAVPLSLNTQKVLQDDLQKFDQEVSKIEEADYNQVKWKFLGKLIALVLHTVITPLPEGRTMLPQAVQTLTDFLPNKLELLKAVNEWLDVYSHQAKKKAGTVLSQSMFNHASFTSSASMETGQIPIQKDAMQDFLQIVRSEKAQKHFHDEPQLFLRLLKLNVAIGFAKMDELEINLFTRTIITNQLIQAKGKKENFLPIVFKSSTLQDFLLAHMTRGLASAYLADAWFFHLIGLLFAIPVQAQPLPQASWHILLEDIKKLDENPHPNLYDQLAEIILTVLYHSCLFLPNPENAFRDACKRSIDQLYLVQDSNLRIRIQFGGTRYLDKIKPELCAPSMSTESLLFFEPDPSKNKGRAVLKGVTAKPAIHQ